MRQLTGLRYAVVAGICMLTNNLILICAARMGVGMTAGLAASFCTVLPLGYGLHSRFTFSSAYDAVAFLRYAAAMAANLPLSFVVLWFFYKFLGLPMTVAAPVATIGMVIINFVVSRWAITLNKPVSEGF